MDGIYLPLQIKEMLCYGLDKLFTDDEENTNPSFSNEFFTSILGETNSEGYWQPIVNDNQPNAAENVSTIDHIYLFEGMNYKPQPSKSDQEIVVGMAQTKEVTDIAKNPKVRKLNTNKNSDDGEKPRNIAKKVNQRKIRMWEDNHYRSRKIEYLEDNDETVGSSNGGICDITSGLDINFVIGDVTSPLGNVDQMKIVCHLVGR